MSRSPASCPQHWGFPLGNCARCLAGPVMAVPVPESTRKMHRATTTGEARARRLRREAEIALLRHDSLLAASLGVRP
jgi:hypothetical protein